MQRPSMLPKPRRPGSTDRLSNHGRRPSAGGHRASSAEPVRATFGGGRLSREASATKGSGNGRSRSQQSERFGQPHMTPLKHWTPSRSNHYSRSTTTPVRTPSQDRDSRGWQTSLERALAFVTVKDQRAITSMGWQRSECARVGEALATRGVGGGTALMRPLTIARFVDITGALLKDLTFDAKLNNDNYVTKLPHLCKRLLYPGTVSKSWLKTVNTLHAFPHALALISYLLDLVNHIEMPVLDDWLYVDKDDLSCLRRDYLNKCWDKFQGSDPQFEELDQEYLQDLRTLLGIDEQKVVELEQTIKQYEECLNDEEDKAARAEEARHIERRDALLAAIKAQRALRLADRARYDTLKTTLHDHVQEIKNLDVEIERLSTESQQLDQELESQPLTVEQRTKMLADVDYSLKVQESKRTLAQQVAKMVANKETELTLWQKKTLGSCLKYNQGLIHLSMQYSDLAQLAIDENELMSPECAAKVSSALDMLRARADELAQRRDEHAREKSAHARKRAALLDETRAKVGELRALIKREQESLASARSQESAEAAAAAADIRVLNQRFSELKLQHEEFTKAEEELRYWETQHDVCRKKLEAMNEYISSQRLESKRLLQEAIEQRAQTLVLCVDEWKCKLAQ